MERPATTTQAVAPEAKPYIALVLALGAVAVAATTLVLVRSPPAAAPGWLLLAALAVSAFLLQRNGFVLHWRGQRVATTFDEPLLFLGLVALGPSVLPALAIGAAASQVVSRRAPVKAAYNVAQHATAGAAGALAYVGLAALGTPALGAAVVAAATYSLSSYLLMSGLFARIERAGVLRTYRERFLSATVANTFVGSGLGVCLVALWAYHPLATLAVAPFVVLAVAFTRQTVRLEREARVRHTLARVTTNISATTSVDRVAEQIVHACGELFLAGRVVLGLRPGIVPSGFVWEAEFEGGPDTRAPPLEATITSRDGETLGKISVYAAQRAPTARDVQLDQPLLDMVAAEASSALQVAIAIRELVELEHLHESIVRRMPAGVLRLGADGEVVEANASFEQHLGDPQRAWLTLAGIPELAEGARRALGGAPFGVTGLRVNERVFDVSGEPLQNLDGRAGAILLFHDVSQRVAAERAERRHSITRPLVRRIVLDLVHNAGASEQVIGSVGRRLAAEVESDDVARFAETFREMGLGDLRFDNVAGETYTFTADDLLERRRERTREPTCHLARGFLEGLVAKLHNQDALGSELRCQSQGHASCVFAVKPRPRPRPPLPRETRVRAPPPLPLARDGTTAARAPPPPQRRRA